MTERQRLEAFQKALNALQEEHRIQVTLVEQVGPVLFAQPVLGYIVAPLPEDLSPVTDESSESVETNL